MDDQRRIPTDPAGEPASCPTQPAPTLHTAHVTADQPIAGIQVIFGDAADGKYFRVLNALIDQGVWASLTDRARNVLVPLLRHANKDRLAWPSIATLMQATGLRKTAVYDALADLIAAGVLEEVESGTRGRSATYRVLAAATIPPRRNQLNDESAAAERDSAVADTVFRRGGISTTYRKKTTEHTNEENETAATGIAARRPAAMRPADGFAAAVALLRREGFGEREAKRLAELGGYQHVRDMIDNCNVLERRGKLKHGKGRGGRMVYLRNAIRGGWGLYHEVERKRMEELYAPLIARLIAVVRARMTPETEALLSRTFGDAGQTVRRGVLSLEELQGYDDDALWETLLSRAREADKAGCRPAGAHA